MDARLLRGHGHGSARPGATQRTARRLELHPAKIEDPKAMVSMIDAGSQAIAATMTTHLVSRAVNSVRMADPADPALIAPVGNPRR
ncbi:hypothetical protein [Sanguibacter suarezii]|uniref:hypothetical protein n=1 Tax=Sanguibacter suarezii TaxID=60921 RepID=UPI0012F802E0|nr:hypothetical protein [Sanguibacter suarezii]